MVDEDGVVDGVSLIVDTHRLGVLLVEDIRSGAEYEFLELRVVVVEVLYVVEERRRRGNHVRDDVYVSVVGLHRLLDGGVVEHDMSHYLSLPSEGVDAYGDILPVPHHQSLAIVHVRRRYGDVGDMAVGYEGEPVGRRLLVVVVGDDEEGAHLVLLPQAVVDAVLLEEPVHRR